MSRIVVVIFECYATYKLTLFSQNYSICLVLTALFSHIWSHYEYYCSILIINISVWEYGERTLGFLYDENCISMEWVKNLDAMDLYVINKVRQTEILSPIDHTGISPNK
jgi:hypothetical protein